MQFWYISHGRIKDDAAVYLPRMSAKIRSRSSRE